MVDVTGMQGTHVVGGSAIGIDGENYLLTTYNAAHEMIN